MRGFFLRATAALYLSAGAGCASAAEMQGICTRAVAEAVAISNGEFEARFSLNTGRLIFFGPEGGQNLLWVNSDRGLEEYHRRKPTAYLNFGGEKLWPIAQCRWRDAFGKEWPPPAALEGAPWRELCRTKRSLTVESAPIPALHLVITREFTLSPTGAELLVRNRLRRVAASPFPVLVWSIAQLPMPEFCVLELPADPPEFIEYTARGYAEAVAGKRLVRQGICKEAEGAKSGTRGSFVAAVYPDGTIFLQCHMAVRGGCYPENASIQAYSNPYYIELETLDEQLPLLPGEEREATTVWKFFDSGLLHPEGEELADLLEHEVGKLKSRVFRTDAEPGKTSPLILKAENSR